MQGPNLTSTLLGVLSRFRQEPVAMMADIEGMYHQVKVTSSDSNYLRFLWWPKGDITKYLVEYRMTVHLFGATSSASCASFVQRRTAEDNVQNYSPEAIATIMDNFCVDDYLKSVSTASEAKVLCNDEPV